MITGYIWLWQLQVLVYFIIDLMKLRNNILCEARDGNIENSIFTPTGTFSKIKMSKSRQAALKNMYRGGYHFGILLGLELD
jgi:hypothetical protein